MVQVVPVSIPSTHGKSLAWWHPLVIPALERWRQGDP